MAGVSGADLLEWWSEWPKWSGWGRGRGSTWIGECSSCLLHPRHHDCDSQIHNLVSLQRGPLQPYCPPETHLYQEQLRWRSRHPPHPHHHLQQNAITAIMTNNTSEHAFNPTYTYSWPKVNVATNGEGLPSSLLTFQKERGSAKILQLCRIKVHKSANFVPN